MPMNPVIHFEMPAENKKRMRDFYTQCFGWETTQLGPEMGDYVTVMTAESDEKGPLKPGSINGGFFSKADDPSNQVLSLVIGVEDLTDSIKKVEKAGGKIMGVPSEIPGVGRYVSFIDTEGNRMSLLQPIG